MGNQKAVEEYFKLRARVDGQVKKLEQIHGADITCRPGCSSCCINLTVFPVEFFVIQQELQGTGVSSKDIFFDETASCGFSDKKDLCRIYPYRPIICRTHGLPILFLNDSEVKPIWQISCCELNFRGNSRAEFREDQVLDIEEINVDLILINREFISSSKSTCSAADRIPLRDVLNQ